MMFINGKHHTQYVISRLSSFYHSSKTLLAVADGFDLISFAGAWTVLNMHELAMTSGFAAAYRLGARFPFSGDGECERLFKLYLGLSHGVRAVSYFCLFVMIE